jgi:hypothetical protein
MNNPINASMDAIPPGKGLIHEYPCVVLIKDERIGSENSKEKANKLAINRFLAIFNFQEMAMAAIAVIIIIEPINNKVSEILENTIELPEDPRTSFKLLAYAISSKILPQKTAATQAYRPTTRKRNLSIMFFILSEAII